MLQKSPNRWSCLPTAFANLLNQPLEELLKLIGHDGSEIIFKCLPEPECRRAFHLQELVDCCVILGFSPVVFEASPVLAAGVADWSLIQFPGGNESRINKFLTRYEGVLIGETLSGRQHAVTWDREKCFDPNGTTYPASEFRIREFVALI